MAGKFKDMEALFDSRRDEQRHGRRDQSDREKPSWRDLDRKRDRSGGSAQASGSGHETAKDRYQDKAAQKLLKDQLNELFEDKEAKTLRKAILDADRTTLKAAVAAYADAKGSFPSDDPALLEKAIDVRKAAHLLLVIDAVSEHLPTADPATKKMFLLKLRGKSRTIFDKKVAATIRRVLAEHGDPR
ncbi:MAG: hypothetical protein KDA24_05600 [Deltaproteobacteria bacterium]|nr:hypothetical protein [Deltaproteobacteria bacterium]